MTILSGRALAPTYDLIRIAVRIQGLDWPRIEDQDLYGGHGVSRLRSGNRHTLGLIFHDAQ